MAHEDLSITVPLEALWLGVPAKPKRGYSLL
jgi:hypothetical protein